jgi:hypothetical protein
MIQEIMVGILGRVGGVGDKSLVHTVLKEMRKKKEGKNALDKNITFLE